MFPNGLQALIDQEQQPTGTVYLETVKLIVEQAFTSFLEELNAMNQDTSEKLLESIKACRVDLEENSNLLKAHAGLLKGLMSKINDIRTITRDVAVKLEVPLPLKKNERKSRSPGFTKTEIDNAMDSTQTKLFMSIKDHGLFLST
ncbi:hypothetical protein MBANPS3_008946 [Mucor bainieri]